MKELSPLSEGLGEGVEGNLVVPERGKFLWRACCLSAFLTFVLVFSKLITVEWRRLHNEEINYLYCSPNIERVIKSRRMRLAGHVARMGEERGCIGSWWGNRRERDHWGDLGVDGWIILGWISRRWYVRIWTGLGWPRKPEGKRPLGRPRRRWVDNIMMDLQEVVCVYMDWIGLAQDRDRWRTLVSAVMNLGVP